MSKLSNVKSKASHVAKGVWTPTVLVGDNVDPASYPYNRENFAFEVSGLLPSEVLQTPKGPIENGSIVFFNSLGEIAGVGGGGGGAEPVPLSWVVIDHLVGALPGYEAVPGDALLVDTSVAEVHIILPPSPAEGEFVNIAPLTPTFHINNLTVYRNGENISGIADDVLFNQNFAVQFVYINPTIGWAVIQGGETSVITDVNPTSAMISATITDATSSPFLIGVLPSNSIVTKCNIMVDTAYTSGSPTLTIGGQFNTSGISIPAYSNLLVSDHYSNECFYRSGTGVDRNIQGVMVAGTGAFEATILIEYQIV